jgi:hypothetical protein
MARAPVRARSPVRAPVSAPPKPQMGSGKLILWSIVFVGILFVFTGSVIVVLVGMAPTIVALIIDRTPKKYAAFCVGGMNFAGAFPWLMKLWAVSPMGGVKDSIAIAFNPFNLTVMYGAAAFGWLIYQTVPPIVAAMIAVSAQHRIAQLRSRQRELIKEWGDAIALAPKEGAP